MASGTVESDVQVPL